MVLFIFESLGTSELILIGIVALLVLGPRRLPELARKAGKIMAEFRGTASEFKETWEREVNFEEESKLLNLDSIEEEVVAREKTDAEKSSAPELPAIKEVDSDELKRRFEESGMTTSEPKPDEEPQPEHDLRASEPVSDKTNWL